MYKHKNDKGSILLEILLMLGILIVVFPILQKNIKQKSDTLRNQLVVKDMTKLKTATENYLKLKPDIKLGVSEIPFSVLEENGLPKNFKKVNIIGQNYKVKVRAREKSDGNVEYDAIIIADGNPEIPDMRIRDIVKESKGFGGYLEDGIIYGASWSLDAAGWGERWATPPIVFKIGFAKKDYQYISRNGFGSSTMRTDLFMNLNNIDKINNFIISAGVEGLDKGVEGKIEVNDLFLSASGVGDVNILSVDDQLTLNKVMDASKSSVSFINGINQPSLSFDDEATSSIILEETLQVMGNLLTSSSSISGLLDKFTFITAKKLSVNVPVNLFVGALIKTPALSSIYAQFGNMNLSNVNIDTNLASGGSMGITIGGVSIPKVGFVFNNIYSLKNKTKYNILSSPVRVNLSDVVVKNVNDQFLGNRIGNIVITEKTPLSVVLRGLSYEYADIYRVVKNNYDGMVDPMPGLIYDEYYRCAKQQCTGNSSNDNMNWSN